MNLRITDFCPAEIRRPVWEVKVIASHFFLQRKHKNKDKSLVIGSELFFRIILLFILHLILDFSLVCV